MTTQLYYLSYCPFCHKLKEFLEENDVQFELIDVTDDLKAKEKIKSQTGHRTFPQLVIDDKFIGDCSSVIENFEELQKTYNL
ncbi:MAG: glutaredoxin family protein [Candidatus Nanoarchaeia archaeon]